MIPSSKLPRHLKTRVPYPRAVQAPADTGPPKIEIRKLDFYYGASQALRNINMALADRSITAFIGPSGCGKSTLLRVLNRMYALYPHQRAVVEIEVADLDLRRTRIDGRGRHPRIGDARLQVPRQLRRRNHGVGPPPFDCSSASNILAVTLRSKMVAVMINAPAQARSCQSL